MDGAIAKGVWDGMLDYDDFFQTNMRNIDTDPVLSKLMGNNSRSNYMIEERHTDQLDYNLAVNVQHNMRHNMRIVGGANLRVNRTNYYSEIKDLLGGDYWYDIDKFAERDMASAEAYQNDLDYYWATGHAALPVSATKYGYYYRAHLLETNAWANYTWGIGGFSLGVSGSVGYSNMYREGMWRKGLFPNDSKGDSKKLDYLTYDAKLSLGYKFSGAHSIEANVAYMQQAPKFATAFVSPRTRNTTTPGLKAEKVFGADLTYNPQPALYQGASFGILYDDRGPVEGHLVLRRYPQFVHQLRHEAASTNATTALSWAFRFPYGTASRSWVP